MTPVLASLLYPHMSFTAPCTLHGEAGLVCRSIFKLMCPKITNLLIIADRFLLLNLKQLCEVQLEKSLDLSTVAALFELSLLSCIAAVTANPR